MKADVHLLQVLLDVMNWVISAIGNNIQIFLIMLLREFITNNTHLLFKQVEKWIVLKITIQYLILLAKHGAHCQDSRHNLLSLITHMVRGFLGIILISIKFLYNFVSKTIHANKKVSFVEILRMKDGIIIFLFIILTLFWIINLKINNPVDLLFLQNLIQLIIVLN